MTATCYSSTCISHLGELRRSNSQIRNMDYRINLLSYCLGCPVYYQTICGEWPKRRVIAYPKRVEGSSSMPIWSRLLSSSISERVQVICARNGDRNSADFRSGFLGAESRQFLSRIRRRILAPKTL